MKKATLLVFVLCGCAMEQTDTINKYKLEKYNGSEVPVCVNYQQDARLVKSGWYDTDACGNEIYIPDEYEPIKDTCNKVRTKIVPYDYCLAQLPKPVHLVEKKLGDITICYDRNNKVDLPILYCQKDMINIQTTDVHTNVFQQTKLNNQNIFY